jgi:hypothetical protein
VETQIHTELAKQDEKFRALLKDEFKTFQERILVDLKNIMLEQAKDVGQALNHQDKKLALLEQSVKNNKDEMRVYHDHTNKFKAEVRDALKDLEYAGQRTKGASNMAKWLVTSGISGGLISLLTLAYQVLK